MDHAWYEESLREEVSRPVVQEPQRLDSQRRGSLALSELRGGCEDVPRVMQGLRCCSPLCSGLQQEGSGFQERGQTPFRDRHFIIDSYASSSTIDLGKAYRRDPGGHARQ